MTPTLRPEFTPDQLIAIHTCIDALATEYYEAIKQKDHLGLMWTESNVKLFINKTTENEMSRAGLQTYWQHKKNEVYRQRGREE